MRKYIFSIFLLTIYINNINTANAGVLDTAFFKIRGIFGSSSKTELAIGADSNQDFALKANYKNSNIYAAKDASNTDTARYATANTNKNTNNEVDYFLEAEVGPMRTSTDDELVDSENIQVYEVKKGDTLAGIAKIYNVSKNTVAWANDIKDGKPKEGSILVILPISGIKHTVKKGDSIKTLAKKYNAEVSDILEFNNINADSTLTLGEDVIIPDGKMNFDAPASTKKMETKKKTKRIYASAGAGYFVRPIVGGIRTQGIHGHNGVDIAAPIGTPLLAAANGTVLVAKGEGYNGGYGRMVIISHSNGTQTVYGHMNSVYVSNGQNVTQGEQIGESGNSGKSTGPHLHFEVRGAENPF
jgi:LysM repeat protein